ncbi:PREDICTED: uncharacterized protein LOC104785999 isoform X2 [Camelina sativa]|uniref:Uncharacterized protein LOC104785999 isoform X2 n=1 Tax=Camelina sativa TaxID=90675 RepID=A0ABM0Z2R4_CAMSA|nr:PREDICTED: uncharacterized protein LOC104785999 isoform X2 [Camelina sativa]
MAMAAAIIYIQDVLSDDFDYEIWSPVTKTTLKEKELWDVVENGVPPDPSKVPELAAKIQPEELSKWRDLAVKDMKALQVLQSSLTESVFRKTLSASSAKEVWDLLKGNNEQAKLRRLETQFQELTMDESEPMKLYVDRVFEIVERFRISGKLKSDHLIMRKLLTSLPSSYDVVLPMLDELMDLPNMSLPNLLVVFEMLVPGETMHPRLEAFLKDVKSMSNKGCCGVCNENNHNQEDCCYSFPEVAEDSSGGGAGQSKPKKGKCFQCGERGHYASDCNTERGRPASKTHKGELESEYEYESESESEELEPEPDYLVLNDSTAFDETMWMVSRDSTNHMTPFKKFFTTLDRSQRALLMDGSNIMAEGKGDVKIRTKEGKKKLIRNVLFVPGININVFSVDQMASRGYSRIIIKDKCIFQKMKTGEIFGETVWEENRGYVLRLQVIEGNLTS